MSCTNKKQLIDLLIEQRSYPAPIARLQNLLYTTNKSTTIQNSTFTDPIVANTEYINFVSLEIIRAVQETEFRALYGLATGDQLKFNAGVFNYFFKKFTYDIASIYSSIIKHHSPDVLFLVKALEKYTPRENLVVLQEAVFNPTNNIWGFSALCTLFSMYVRFTEGKNANA